MRLRTLCLGALAMLGAAVVTARPALAGECAPVRLGGDLASLSEPWRRALDALVAATAREGQPWSCPGARITLLPPGDHGLARLEVEDASGVRRRPVASPADVVPLGEAMLARTIAPVPVHERPSAHPPRDGRVQAMPVVLGGAVPPPPMLTLGPPVPTPNAMPPFERGGAHPDLLVSALAGARYTGPTRAMMVGPELRVALGFGRWSAGLLARYDAAVKVFDRVPDQFSLTSVSIGLPLGCRMLSSPIELRAEAEPSLAVVMMGGNRPGEQEPDVDTKVDMRLGARLSAAVPLTGVLRAVAALGAEGAPAALFDDREPRHHSLPHLPAYMAGVSVGLEIGLFR